MSAIFSAFNMEYNITLLRFIIQESTVQCGVLHDKSSRYGTYVCLDCSELSLDCSVLNLDYSELYLVYKKDKKYSNSDRSLNVLEGLEGSLFGDLFFDGFSPELVSLLRSAIPGDTEADHVEKEEPENQSSSICE